MKVYFSLRRSILRAKKRSDTVGKILYLQTDKNVKVTKEKILLGEIASLSCRDKNILARCQARTVAVLPRGNYGRYGFSALELIRAVEKEEPELEVVHIGEPEFVVAYENPRGKNRIFSGMKIVFVSLVTFFGTAFSIMTFNTDVDIHTLFANIYQMFTGEASGGFTVLEVTYSAGIALGALLFFNHFGRFRISDDPTPMEVQMRIYQEDVDATVLEKERKKE